MTEATVRIDPHVHSEGSYDAHDPVEVLLEQAAEIGLDGIVVTDHDAIAESLRAADLAEDYGLLGIPGVEVSTAAGHLLAIGVTECPDPGRPLGETIATVRDQGGAAVIPHPFQRTRHGVRKRSIETCDAIEVYNSWLFTGYRNRRANGFARERGFPPVAASDAHSAAFIGRAFTELSFEDVSGPGAIDGTDVVEAIVDGGTEVHGRRQPVVRSVRHYAVGARRRLGYAVRTRFPGVSNPSG